MENNNGVFRTSDLGLATFLYSLGGELTGIDRTDPRQAVFAFQLTDDQRGEIAKWQSGIAMVNGLAFWASYQRLKLELYDKARR